MVSRKFAIEIRKDVINFKCDGIEVSEALGLLTRQVVIGAVEEALKSDASKKLLKRKFNTQQTKAKTAKKK